MKPDFEVADVIDIFFSEAFRKTIPVFQQRTLKALSICRTAALGGHKQVCTSCGIVKYSYNSCRNNACPKCQGLKKEMWIIQREEELLPVSYFHVVFTLPHELNELCLRNPRFMYDLIFKAAWYTLNVFNHDPKWLGAKSGATMVLHTWGQNLQLHPHVHCIVPSGGLNKSGSWQNPKRGNSEFLFPVLAMNKIFKAYFLKTLRRHLEDGLLALPIDFPFTKGYYNWKEKLYNKEWVVYSKPPFGGVKNVVKYLARYSHRVAITNHRIVDISNGKVFFRYRDYADNNRVKILPLDGALFLRRFCLHILPPNFRKIRHYGFLSNAAKTKSLTLARAAFCLATKVALTRNQRKALAKKRVFGNLAHRCSCCGHGQMVIFEIMPGNKDPPNNSRFRMC